MRIARPVSCAQTIWAAITLLMNIPTVSHTALRLCAPLIRLIFSILAIAAFALAVLAAPSPARADPADVAASARGVVRVVILGHDGDQIFPISHGSGFVVSGDKIVTNGHVVAELLELPGLSIGIVPPQGGEAVLGRLIAYSPRNDLALIEATIPLKLPSLAIAGGPPDDSAIVSGVGYPMNVDRAQGLSIADVLRPQPPVKSRGFVSGERPSRDFDTVLHTAPIARGNSGGPLLDNCGRVVGVNSFGAESEGTDAEFFFAVSVRELLPFLRANKVAAQINGQPCRSIAELDAQERAVQERETARTMEIARRQEAADQRKRAKALRQAELEVLAERDNGMAIAALLLALALGSGIITWQAKGKDNNRQAAIAGGITALALIGMLLTWFSRPGLDAIDRRSLDALRENSTATKPLATPKPTPSSEATMICTIDLSRSRVTSAKMDDIPISWQDDGCVNTRTQYGLADGSWSRVFVPNDEEVVSVNRYEPAKREYRIERYLLGRTAMTAARDERSNYKAPACNTDTNAAQELGQRQAAILALLPERPNERLVYKCHRQAK